MTDHEIVRAARQLLHDVDDPVALLHNLLFKHITRATFSYNEARSLAFRALERLDSSSAVSAERRSRWRAILSLCDVERVDHKETMSRLSLSRRQFYRDRRAALLAFGRTVRSHHPAVANIELDLVGAHLLHIDTLRQQGSYDLMWLECTRVLRNLHGDPREIKVLAAAAEATRLLGDMRESRCAIERMRSIAIESSNEPFRRLAALRVAAAEVALDWMSADLAKARTRISEAMDAFGDQQRVYDGQTLVLGQLFAYGAWIAVDMGEWVASAEFTVRLEKIGGNDVGVKSASHVLRGRIALQANGDILRASSELREAITLASSYYAPVPRAIAAVELGRALLAGDDVSGVEYIRRGLAIARDTCGVDDFAVLSMATLPEMIPYILHRDAEEAMKEVRRRAALARRAELFARLARVAVDVYRSASDELLVVTLELANELEVAQMRPAAALAYLLHTDALLKRNRCVGKQRRLKHIEEFIALFGDAVTRKRFGNK